MSVCLPDGQSSDNSNREDSEYCSMLLYYLLLISSLPPPPVHLLCAHTGLAKCICMRLDIIRTLPINGEWRCVGRCVGGPAREGGEKSTATARQWKEAREKELWKLLFVSSSFLWLCRRRLRNSRHAARVQFNIRQPINVIRCASNLSSSLRGAARTEETRPGINSGTRERGLESITMKWLRELGLELGAFLYLLLLLHLVAFMQPIGVVRWPHFQWPHRIASCRRGFAGKWRLGRLFAQLLVLAAAVLSRLFVHGAVSVCCSFCCCCCWWWCTSLWLLLQCSFTLILVTPQLI